MLTALHTLLAKVSIAACSPPVNKHAAADQAYEQMLANSDSPEHVERKQKAIERGPEKLRL